MSDSEVRIRTALDNSGISGDIKSLTKEFNSQVAVIQKQSKALEEMNRQLEAISKGEVEVKSIAKMEANLKKVTKEVEIQQKAYDELGQRIEKASMGVEFAKGIGRPEDIAKAEVEYYRLDQQSIELATSLESARDNATQLSDRIKEVKLDPTTSDEAIQLKNNIANTTVELEQSKNNTTGLNNKIKELSQQKVDKIKNGIKSVGKESSSATTGIEKLANKIKTLVLTAFVFSVIRKALRGLTESLGNALMSNTQFANSLNNIKVNLLTAFAPIWEIIQPASIAFMEILQKITLAIAQFMSMIFGKTLAQSKASAKALANTAKGLDKVKKSANGAATSIDEFNIIAEQDVDTGLNFGTKQDIGFLNSLQEPFAKLLELLIPIREALGRLWEAFLPFSKTVGEGLYWIWENVLKPFGVWALTTLIPAVIDLIAAAFGALNQILIAFKPYGQSLWDNFFKPLRDFTWKLIIDGITLITNALKAFTNWASQNQELVGLITTAVLGFLAGIWIYNTVKDLVTFMKGLGKAFTAFGDSALLMGIKTAIPAIAIGLLAAGIIAVAATWDKMSGAQKAITILGSLAAAAIAAAIAIAVFQTSWSVGLAAAAIVGGIALITSAFSTIKRTAGDLGNFSTPNIFGMSSNVDVGSINPAKFSRNPLPALATGTVLPGGRPFAAIVNDQPAGQTNIEAPLDTIKQGLAEVFAEMGGMGGDVNINFTGDLAQLARILNPQIELVKNQQGIQNISPNFAFGGGFSE